jgi:hypothetical protein
MVLMVVSLFSTAAFAEADSRSDGFPTRAKDQTRPSAVQSLASSDEECFTGDCLPVLDYEDPESAMSGGGDLCKDTRNVERWDNRTCRRDSADVYWECRPATTIRVCTLKISDKTGLPMACKNCDK